MKNGSKWNNEEKKKRKIENYGDEKKDDDDDDDNDQQDRVSSMVRWTINLWPPLTGGLYSQQISECYFVIETDSPAIY